MRKLNNTEAELKKSVAYKRKECAWQSNKTLIILPLQTMIYFWYVIQFSGKKQIKESKKSAIETTQTYQTYLTKYLTEDFKSFLFVSLLKCSDLHK